MEDLEQKVKNPYTVKGFIYLGVGAGVALLGASFDYSVVDDILVGAGVFGAFRGRVCHSRAIRWARYRSGNYDS